MIPREAPRRRRSADILVVAMLTGVVCLATAMLVINLPPRFLARVLGLKHVGPLETALPAQSTPLTLGGENLDYVEVTLPPQTAEPVVLTAAKLGGPLVGEISTPGTTTYLLVIGERELQRLLWEWVFPDGFSNQRYRNVEVDLKSQGVVVYADVHLGLRWQRMGLLLVQDERGLTLSPAGLVLDQQFYAMPEEESLARVFVPTGRQAQRRLRALTVVGPMPGKARAEAISFHGDQMQILARATYVAASLPDTGWQSLEPGVELREMDVAADSERPAERLRVVRLDPALVRFRVGYDPANPKTVSAWGKALHPLLVVNGSYFAPENEGTRTVGLLISHGQRWGTPLADYAGMFAVTTAGDVTVRWLRHQPFDPREPLVEAVQSFPVLVKPGGVLGFPPDADDGIAARRTVVAQDRGGNILFIVAPRGYLSLHEVAAFLTRPDLAVDVALNLDGGGSAGMWLASPAASVDIDSFTPVPSIIAVERQ